LLQSRRLTRLASRRRRRKTIGKVVSDVERRVRVVEKRPGAKRIKRNVVTAEKIRYRAIVAKNVATDGITPNEVSFGTPIVSTTEPTDYLKEGSSWYNPDTNEQKIYDPAAELFSDVAAVDLTARASADGKNTIYRQNAQPTGGTYVTGDTWFDQDDNNKIYRYNGTSWVALQLGGNALANISANSITSGTIDASVITVSNLDAGNITAGSISASRITTGTISASISITSATITGSTITGGTIRTAASGQRIQLSTTDANRIYFYGSGTTTETVGAISVDTNRIFMVAPGTTYGNGAVFSMYGDQHSLSNGIFMNGGDSSALGFAMSGSTVSLSSGETYKLRVTTSGVTADGAATASGYHLRNARITTVAPTSGAASETTDGNIVLVREA
jgi:hypothetical protein